MSLQERLAEYVRAAFTGIWIQSQEHDDALAEIARLCKQQNWSMAIWDIDRGLQVAGQETPGGSGGSGLNDPLAAIRSINALAKKDSSALLVLPNFHRLIQSAEIVQCLAHQTSIGKQNRTFVVVLAPVVTIPIELQTQFAVIEHELPGRDQLQQIASGVATESGEMPDGEGLERLLDAAAGLTRFEAENAFSLSLVRHCKLTPEAVWELKVGMLKKAGLLSLHRGSERFADLGGLEAVKSFCLRALGRRSSIAKPRGILLLGVPGTGKSALAKALGNEMGRPTLTLDVGALMGSLVGATEQNVRQALRIADAMSPSILFCDEIEKALSGVASSGQTDSGVSARLFSSLLTWLSDHESDVFFIATANDISKLPPEFVRAERFDAIYFLDIPGTAEKEKIWPIYLKMFGLSAQADARPNDRDWTGAEIRSCCRLAALLDLPLREAAQHVVPVAVTAADAMERLRTWASGRCLDASRGGVYNRAGGDAVPVRRVTRSASN